MGNGDFGDEEGWSGAVSGGGKGGGMGWDEEGREVSCGSGVFVFLAGGGGG